MQNFLKETKTSAKGLDILDLGASTGGFTDCLLQEGAVSATCVDVGHGQLHYKLRTDPRVTNHEKTNLRHLTAQSLDQPFFDLVVMDLSFISLRKVLPQAWSFVQEAGKMIALVKPQFEVGHKNLSRAGIVRDPALRTKALDDVKDAALESGFGVIDALDSPIQGGDGNHEYLLRLERL